MSKEKSAFPLPNGATRYDPKGIDGISQDYYAAVRIYPVMLKIMWHESDHNINAYKDRKGYLEAAAELTVKAVEALNQAMEGRDGKGND